MQVVKRWVKVFIERSLFARVNLVLGTVNKGWRVHTQHLPCTKVGVCQQSHHSDSWDAGVNSTPYFRKWNNCGSCALKSSLDLGLTELLLWRKDFNCSSWAGSVRDVWVFCRVFFERMETIVCWPLNSAASLYHLGWRRTQLGKLNSTPLPKGHRTGVVHYTLPKGWWAPSKGCSQNQERGDAELGNSAAREGCKDGVCLWSLSLWSSEALWRLSPKSGACWRWAWQFCCQSKVPGWCLCAFGV